MSDDRSLHFTIEVRQPELTPEQRAFADELKARIRAKVAAVLEPFEGRPYNDETLAVIQKALKPIQAEIDRAWNEAAT